MGFSFGYGYGYGIDGAYLLLVVVSMALGFATQAYIKSTYNKWSKVRSSGGRTGAEMARSMLIDEGAANVDIGRIAGHLTDNYNPRDNMLRLSEENFSGGSVASIAVACHEAGHAVQTARGFAFARFRSALAPVVSITQSVWMLVFIVGVMLGMMGLVWAAIALFGFSVLFQLVTLPVEIDASRRAVAYLRDHGSGLDQKGARSVLTAAALTYVAAALVSVMQLVYYLGVAGRSRR